MVLVAARNPLNIGAAARAMSNFGFSRLRVVNPYSVAFREARSAVGAADLLARAEEYSDLAEAISDCNLVVGTTALQHRELQHPLYGLKEGAEIIRKRVAKTDHVALVFGSEKRGLSNSDLSHCHWLAHIPTREQHSSMNLGQAVAVCLYELARDSRTDERVEPPLAASGDLELMGGLWFEALQASGYVKRGAESANQEKIRRLMRRLAPQADDAEVLLGMLRKILWKLRQGR